MTSCVFFSLEWYFYIYTGSKFPFTIATMLFLHVWTVAQNGQTEPKDTTMQEK